MVNIYITVDTETSLGGAWTSSNLRPVAPELSVLGRIGPDLYGVPLIMDILEEYDLRATFFTEVLARDVVGPSELAEAYASIKTRGHDPQLHLHPVFHFYHLVRQGVMCREELPPRMDLIGGLPLEMQLDLLQRGCSIFRDIFGAIPTAFRAGCYGASMPTLEALEKTGIFYDSSFNAAYLDSTCLMGPRKATNMPWRSGKVWEIPVTTFETGAWRPRGLKPLEVSAVSLMELQQVLTQAEKLGQHTVIVMLHSFSFLKRKDAQFRGLRPDRLVIRRFRKFCAFLREQRSRFRVSTFSEIERLLVDPMELPLPRMGIMIPGFRKIVQAVNRVHWV